MTVGLHGGVGANTMSDEYFEQYGLSRELRRRFISDCDALKSEHVDVAIPSHPNHSDLFSRVKSDPMDYSGHVDPERGPDFSTRARPWRRSLTVNGGTTVSLRGNA